MHSLSIRVASALLCAAAAAASLAACKPPADNTNNQLTADPKAFVIHNVTRYSGQDANSMNSQILVVEVTYTNTDQAPQTIQPNRFALLDQTTQAQYKALAGGDIHVPSMAFATLDPGKTIDLTLGFRVPLSMTSARLAYAL
jgi:hypothetical protein